MCSGDAPIHSPGLELAPHVYAPPGALRVQFSRASGPGGQNVNKLNTKAELWLDLARVRGLSPAALARLRTAAGPSRLTNDDQLHLSGDASRSQDANRADILRRLRDLIVAARHEPKRRRKTKPTLGSKRRRLDSKKRRGELKANRRAL